MSGRPINALELYSRFRNEMNKPDPFRANEVPVDRGFLAPLATYADGQTELALPTFPLGAIWDGVRSFGAQGFDTPEAIRQNAGAAADAAGGAVMGGLGVGLAGGMADDAVRAVPKAKRLTPMEQAIADTRRAIADFEAQYSVPATQPPRAEVVPGYGYVDQSAMMRDEVPIQSYLTTDLAGAVGEGSPLMADMSQMYRLRRERSESPFDLREPDPSMFTASEVPGMAALRGAERLASPDGISLDYMDLLNALERPTYLNANAPTGSSVPLAMNALERAGAQPQRLSPFDVAPINPVDQVRLAAAGDRFPEGAEMPPIVAVRGMANTDAPYTVIDGNNRVRLAQQRNQPLDGVVLDDATYQRLAEASNFDDQAIAIAATRKAGLNEQVRALEDQWAGLSTLRTADDLMGLFANAPTASAVPLAGETDQDNPLFSYLRMIGL